MDKLLLSEDLICFFDKKVSKTEAIGHLIDRLERRGFVKSSFKKAALEREKVFPTGLPTQPLAVAIPHTDSVHVKKSAVAVGILAEPVTFIEMGTTDSEIEVYVITVLAVDEKGSMVEVLCELAREYRDQDFISRLHRSQKPQDVLDIFTAALQNVETIPPASQVGAEEKPVIDMLGIDQVGLVVEDIQETAAMFKKILGIESFKVIDWPMDGIEAKSMFRGLKHEWQMKLAFAQVGPLQIELIQPVGDGNQFSDFLKKHGPGLHHLRVLVEDIDANSKNLMDEGFEMLSTGTGVNPGSRWAYFDTTEQLGGLLIELRKKLESAKAV